LQAVRALIARWNPHHERIVLQYCLRAFLVSTAISIVLSQIFLFAFIALSLPFLKRAIRRPEAAPLRAPIGCWVFIMALSAGVAVNPLRSVMELIQTSAYFYLPFAVCDYLCRFQSAKERAHEIGVLILCLSAGQAVASVARLIVTALGMRFGIGLPGPVTQSGQLALVLPALLGFLLTLRQRDGLNAQRAFASLLFLSIICIGWGGELSARAGWIIQLAGLGGAFLALHQLGLFAALQRILKPVLLDERVLAFAMLALLFSAFLFNLKRGPWFGVFVAFLVISYLLNRKLGLRALLLALIAVVALAPVRERLMNFGADFTILGGRKEMWTLGLELIQRFPLGVGVQNSDVMRALNPYLPPTHRHLHNNFLNVAVETGYLGLIIYLWWMIEVIRLGLRWSILAQDSHESPARHLAVLAVCLGGSILSWQCAGVVEYNFRDAEIRMISFFLMGVLLAADGMLRASPPDQAEAEKV